MLIENNVCLNNFRKNQRNEIKTFSRKCNSIIKDGEFMKKREVN